MKSGIAYRAQLVRLVEQLEEMCGLAASAMERATYALLQSDLVLAEHVITDCEEITALGARAKENAFAVLTFQTPVAGDLRAVVSAIQIVGDIDRMGAVARQVAKMVRGRHPEHVLPEQANGYFAEMGRVTTELAYGAAEVLVSRDPRKAAGIRREYEAVNGLLRHLLTMSTDREWKHGTVAVVDVTLLGRYYERFADHAVGVARAVIFQATGSVTDIESWWPAALATRDDAPRPRAELVHHGPA
ncbi:MAG TPA: phosphate signaling complex protein PhoU [Mycobacterium sp.]|nr:phosphate signaling complex protein PhoU [Mycobacterium sp.]